MLSCHCIDQESAIRPRGYKKITLNSAEHEIFPAHKCENANNCWYFNNYEQEESIIGSSEPEKS